MSIFLVLFFANCELAIVQVSVQEYSLYIKLDGAKEYEFCVRWQRRGGREGV